MGGIGGENVPSGGPLDAHDVSVLEDTARYAVLLLAPVEGFNRGFFCPWGKKRELNHVVLAHFWQFLVPSSNLSNFERNPEKQKKFLKISKIQKYKIFLKKSKKRKKEINLTLSTRAKKEG